MSVESNTKEMERENFCHSIDSVTSRTITALRFALMVLVVLIHNRENMALLNTQMHAEIPKAVDLIQYFFSDILGRSAVPVFLFISSYLLFLKNDCYKLLIKKKCLSILLPYLLWSCLAVFLFFVCQNVLPLRQYFVSTIIDTLDFGGWLNVFTGYQNANAHPLVYQFWFLRDLFLCILISPLIRKAVSKFPVLFLLFLILFLNSSLFYSGIKVALFYFSLGCYAVKYQLNAASLQAIKFSGICILYALLIAVDYVFFFEERSYVFYVFSSIVGAVVFLKLAVWFSKREKVYNGLYYLAGFSFWLYALHEPFFITSIRKLWVKFLPIDGYWLLVEYFGGVLFTVIASLILGIILKRFLPKVFSLLTGAR